MPASEVRAPEVDRRAAWIDHIQRGGSTTIRRGAFGISWCFYGGRGDRLIQVATTIRDCKAHVSFVPVEIAADAYFNAMAAAESMRESLRHCEVDHFSEHGGYLGPGVTF